MIFVVGGSKGGLSPNDALLHINAPVGSTITLAKGGVTVKTLAASEGHTSASDSRLADWYYSVSSSNYGAWTVTASNGTNTVSASVTINTNKQYDVGLTYDLYLLKNGLFQFEHGKNETTETQYNGYIGFYGTWSSCRIWVALTDAMLGAGTYTKLVFDLYGSGGSGYVYFGLATNTSGTSAARTELYTGTATYPRTIEVDISKQVLSGKYAMIWGAYQISIYIRNIYLKR